MQRKITFAINNFYHVFNRGVEKRRIFLNEKDYERFLFLLFFCNNDNPIKVKELFRQGFSLGPSWEKWKEYEKGKELVDIGAYCLMPNHFHLLIKERVENGITNFMRKLSTAYSMYFNKKNDRVGGLFQGRFGAQHLNSDPYLKYIFAYIHLNPVKIIEPFWKSKSYFKNLEKQQEIKSFLENYLWSSYPVFTGAKEDRFILNTKVFPEYFKDTKEFSDFAEDWLKFSQVAFF